MNLNKTTLQYTQTHIDFLTNHPFKWKAYSGFGESERYGDHYRFASFKCSVQILYLAKVGKDWAAAQQEELCRYVSTSKHSRYVRRKMGCNLS